MKIVSSTTFKTQDYQIYVDPSRLDNFLEAMILIGEDFTTINLMFLVKMDAYTL